MLILTRRIGESLRIGEGIKVQVIGIEGHTVRLGFEAPESVQIWRAEIYHRKLTEAEQT